MGKDMESERGRTDAPAAVIDDEAAGFFAALARTNLDADRAIELGWLIRVHRPRDLAQDRDVEGATLFHAAGENSR